MRSPSSIIRNKRSKHALVGWLFPILLWPLIIVGSADGQHLAVIAPDGSKPSLHAAESIADSLSNKLAIVDASLASTAFASADIENPFNLSLEEAKRAGAAIGAEAFILVRAETLRRSSTTQPVYYESYSTERGSYLRLLISGDLLDHWQLGRLLARHIDQWSERGLEYHLSTNPNRTAHQPGNYFRASTGSRFAK